LQRMKARVTADFRSDHLIDGWPGAAASGVCGARNQTAHGFVMAVTRAGNARGWIVQTADDVDVLPEGRERRKAGREHIIGAGFRGNPISLRDSVTVEPQDEAGGNRGFRGLCAYASGGV